MGHNIQGRGSKPVLIGETGGGAFVGFLSGDDALTWSEERQALILGLAILASAFTEAAFAGFCVWQLADQFVNTLNVAYENVAAKVFGITTAIETTEWERKEHPFAFRPNGLNNKGLLSHDRRYQKLAWEVVKALYHPETTFDMAFEVLQQVSAKVSRAKHGKGIILKNSWTQSYLAVHWWNDMDRHAPSQELLQSTTDNFQHLPAGGPAGVGETSSHEQEVSSTSPVMAMFPPPAALKLHTHTDKERASVFEAVAIRAAEDHLAVALRLIGHHDKRTELMQGVENPKDSVIFVAVDDVVVPPSTELEVVAAVNDGGVAAHFQVGLEQEFTSETGFRLASLTTSMRGTAISSSTSTSFNSTTPPTSFFLPIDSCVCLAIGECTLQEASLEQEDMMNGTVGKSTPIFDPWQSSFFPMSAKKPRASQIDLRGRIGFFVIGGESGRRPKGDLHIATRKAGYERDENSWYLGLQKNPQDPSEFLWELDFI
ncbi:unnamed protein product [Amoebophrya sp. A25]|nr:unnamed protein product [Amoebophrya sp. A25]|eukprot:GSA25T00013784001.1